jgi:hypothetical protein
MSNVNTVWYTETITVFSPSIWGSTVLQKHHNPFRPLPILYNFSCSTNHRILSCRCWTAAVAKKHHTRFFVLNFRYKPKHTIFYGNVTILYDLYLLYWTSALKISVLQSSCLLLCATWAANTNGSVGTFSYHYLFCLFIIYVWPQFSKETLFHLKLYSYS